MIVIVDVTDPVSSAHGEVSVLLGCSCFEAQGAPSLSACADDVMSQNRCFLSNVQCLAYFSKIQSFDPLVVACQTAPGLGTRVASEQITRVCDTWQK